MRAGKRIGVSLAAVVSLAAGSVALATDTGASIGVNFGTVVGGGGPSGGSSAIPAGGKAGLPAVQQGNWNDPGPGTGSQANLTLDRAGVPEATTVSTDWISQGASDPGSNDKFESSTSGPPAPQNFELYQGYLDTDDNTTSRVNIRNLPGEFAAGYDLYVYFLGSTSARGGTFGVAPIFTPPAGNQHAIPTNTFQPNKLLNNRTGAWVSGEFGETFVASGPEANGPTFIEDPGVDFTDIGNYAVFRGLTASEFQLFATVIGDRTFGFGDRERASISGIQIVANPVPEPSALALLAVGAATMLRRRNRSAV
jgi:hypothetical protein